MRPSSLLALCLLAAASASGAEKGGLFPRFFAPAAKPTPAPAEPKEKPAAAGKHAKTDASAKESKGVLEASTARRFFNTWQPRIAAAPLYLEIHRSRLAEGLAEVEQIAADRTLAALPPREVRQLGEQSRAARDWAAQIKAEAREAVPPRVEDAMRQAEAFAIRTQTVSAETKNLVTKAGNSRGVAAGAYSWTEPAYAADLMVAHLRPMPGAVLDDTYALKNVDALRAALGQKKTALTEQDRAAREDWLRWNAQSADVHRRYSELRVNLPLAE